MDPLGFSVELAARGSVLLGLTALALLALRRAPAASRQAVAMAGIIGVLALTPLSLAMPRFDLVVLPPAVLEPGATPAHDATVRFLLGSSVALAWGVVAEIALARVALGMWRVARCARRGTELDDPGIARAAAKMGLRLPVRVVVSGEVEVPMTAGLHRPVILLPAPALEWSSERLELVLLHELAHVKRRDCLAMLLGRDRGRVLVVPPAGMARPAQLPPQRRAGRRQSGLEHRSAALGLRRTSSLHRQFPAQGCAIRAGGGDRPRIRSRRQAARTARAAAPPSFTASCPWDGGGAGWPGADLLRGVAGARRAAAAGLHAIASSRPSMSASSCSCC